MPSVIGYVRVSTDRQADQGVSLEAQAEKSGPWQSSRERSSLRSSPYRGKMTADQLSMLEKQYLDRRLLEQANLPRLSLFYLH
jgi:hypothetical protein